MAGKRKNWTVGESLTRTELQRAADLSAGKEERALEAIITPSSGYTKMVIPLTTELLSDLVDEGISGPSTVINHRQLAVGGPAGVPAIGAPGCIFLRACRLIAASTLPTGRKILINFSVTAAQGAELAPGSTLFTPPIASNASGLNRIDLIYATASLLAVNATANRKFKDPSTGAITTQSLTVEQAPLLNLNILQGTPGASPVAPALPADSLDGLTVNWPIATVFIFNGYVSGTSFSTSPGAIAQIWPGGGINHDRTMGRIGSSAKLIAAAPGIAAPAISERVGAVHSMFALLRLLSGASTPTIDNTIDWRRRFVRVSATRPTEAGITAHPTVITEQSVTTAAAATNNTHRIDTKWFFTGSGLLVGAGVNLAPNNADGISGAGVSSLANTAVKCTLGSLGLVVTSHTALNALGDYWAFFIEYTDQFDSNVV